jgi:nicotinamide mononucleotide (NMN) deamidase PncC
MTEARIRPCSPVPFSSPRPARLHVCENVAVAESSTGGLIAAALVAQDGASRYFRGGIVSAHALTGDSNRLANMEAFAVRALGLIASA